MASLYLRVPGKTVLPQKSFAATAPAPHPPHAACARQPQALFCAERAGTHAGGGVGELGPGHGGHGTGTSAEAGIGGGSPMAVP